MNLKHTIKTFDVLNVSIDDSTVTTQAFLHKENKESYIVSETDEEMMLLIEFNNKVNIESITVYAAVGVEKNVEASAPKSIYIYKTNHININFNDIKLMRSDKTVKCNLKKLNKGQTIKLNTSSKNAIKFQKVQYLVIYIASNQNHTEQTYLSGIFIKGARTNANEQDKLYLQLINTETSMDTTIHSSYLLQQQNEYKKESECCVTSCPHITHISNALKQYHSFVAKQQENIDENTLNFDGISLLNDFHHALTIHDMDHFEDIYNILLEKCYDSHVCLLSQCILMQRNHRLRTSLKDTKRLKKMFLNASDVNDIVLQQILDKIHCHYFHSFNIGFKLKRSEKAY
eukprot:52425_1